MTDPMPFVAPAASDPEAFVEELVADLEPADAVELAVELTRMIELGLIELDATGGESRIAIAATPPAKPPWVRA